MAVLWFPAPTASLMEGSIQIKNMERKRFFLDRLHEGDAVEFSHENAGLETLHFHAELKQFKIRLPLALAELPKQNIFQKIKRLV
jgi:hypothetical protein